MPEGDTVWLSATNLNAALAGSVVTRCDIRVPAFATVDLTGNVIDEVVSRGKHLLMRIGDFSIHSHLKMEGVWRSYAPGEKWSKPEFKARVILDAPGVQAVGFELGLLEVIKTQDEEDVVGHLGPDLLGPDWDADIAVARLAADPEVPIYVALLDQRNLAGVGNVYSNEICFLRGVLPTRTVGETPALDKVVDLAERMLQANKQRFTRSTTGDLRPGQTSWVYGRKGRPCRRCGTRLLGGELGRVEGQERVVTWCPRCQT